MQATSDIPRDLTVLFTRLADMERMATTQEWWMFGRVLPEARRLAELSSLLAAARAELAQLLSTLGYPPAMRMTRPGTSELQFAQSFASDEGWGLAHREGAISVLRLAALAVPILLAQIARCRYQMSEAGPPDYVRAVLERLSGRLGEARVCVMGL